MDDFDFDDLEQFAENDIFAKDPAFADRERVHFDILYQYVGFSEIKNARDQFFKQVHAFALSLNLQKELQFLLETAAKIQDIEYKNYNAYVLGYLCLEKKNNNFIISEKTFSKIQKDHETLLKDNGIEAPDLLRYARYWQKILLII